MNTPIPKVIVTESEAMEKLNKFIIDTPIFMQYNNYVIMNKAAFKIYEQSSINATKIKKITGIVNRQLRASGKVHIINEVLNHEIK